MNIITRFPKLIKKHKKRRKSYRGIDLSNCVKSVILTKKNYPIADNFEFPPYEKWEVQLVGSESKNVEDTERRNRRENLLSFIGSLKVAIKTLEPGLFMPGDTHMYLSDTIDGLMGEVADVIERANDLLTDRFVKGGPQR